MNLIFDIETDDLKATLIHCIVAKEHEGKIHSFGPDKINEGLEFLSKANKLIGHNILGFDIPVIKKLYGVDLSLGKDIVDTLVLSRLFKPTREGGHSLEMWGYRLNFHKGEQPQDFTIYNEDMLKYCKVDVQLNELIYNKLREEGKGFSKDSINLEHSMATILKEQEDNGFQFDEKKASLLVASLQERKFEVEEEVHKVFKPKWVDVKEVFPKIKKDGSLSKSGLTEEEYEKINKNFNIDHKEFTNFSFMRKELQEFNLGSRKQIGEYLQDVGWKPKKFTPTGQPIVDEGTLSKIKDIPEAQLIAEYLLLQKRIAQVESWLKALGEDGRVHGFVIPNGTITGRMAHRDPNMAQVPSLKSPYGEECRSCWIVKDGYKLVGVDASGLELRMLAHYMADEEYINEIINGDIHTINQKAAGLESRDQAKTFIYATIYGAGSLKLGSVVGGSKEDGARLKQRFINNIPAFKTLGDRVQKASRKKYLKGLDGRKIYIRHAHAALNSLLQGGGAIVMKRALAMLDSLIKLQTLDAKFVANIHDEWQIEVREDLADFVGKLAVDCIQTAGNYYKLRCPLDGEYKVGGNWSETH